MRTIDGRATSAGARSPCLPPRAETSTTSATTAAMTATTPSTPASASPTAVLKVKTCQVLCSPHTQETPTTIAAPAEATLQPSGLGSGPDATDHRANTHSSAARTIREWVDDRHSERGRTTEAMHQRYRYPHGPTQTIPRLAMTTVMTVGRCAARHRGNSVLPVPTQEERMSSATRHGAPLVSGQAIAKSFHVGNREVQVLHGVGLVVHPGELVAIMGQSGSGKSTLLYCLAGLEQPTSGEVVLDSQPLAQLNRSALARMRRSSLGFVFQQYNLVPTLSAYENVALPWRLNRRRPDRELIMQMMTAMGIADLANKLPSTLSGGEQQRVALARVLAQRPRIVFADEPTGALDTRTGRLVLDEIEKIAHDPGQCVLMVTHDPVVASRCDRVIFMRDGLLVGELAHPSWEQIAETLNQLVEV